MNPSSLDILGTSLVASRHVTPRTDSTPFVSHRPLAGVPSADHFHSATNEEVDAAARAAEAAFEQYSARPPGDRATLLERVAAGIDELGTRLVELVSEETGLPGPRVAGERDRTTRQLRRFAELVREGSWVEAVIDHGDRARQPLPKPDLRRMLRPLGPVVVFGASNFPLAYSTAGGDTASALAAGCPVLVKGHPAHPGTGELVANVIADAVQRLGMPPGTFSFLHAGGPRDFEVGRELVRHPAVRAGGFTGSFQGGTALAKLAAERPLPIPFFAEMGSTNPIVALPKALAQDPAARAQQLFASFTGSVGQMCTCPGLVFYVRDDAGYAFVRELERLVAQAPSAPMLTPRMRAAFDTRVDTLARIEGVRVATATTPRDEQRVVPVVLQTTAARFLANPALHEECFGPSTVLVGCSDLAELGTVVAAVHGSLTATLWASPDERALARRMLEKLARTAGRVIWNGVPTGVEVVNAMVHGGPFPATTRPETTAVGAFAIRRWCRPVCYQDFPEELLPRELEEQNPLGILRLVDGRSER